MIKIYAIRNKYTNEIVYVGKTKQTLNQRLTGHKNDKSHPEKMDYLRKKDCEIIELGTVIIEEGQYWEQYFIDKYKKPIFNRIRAKEKTIQEAKKDIRFDNVTGKFDSDIDLFE